MMRNGRHNIGIRSVLFIFSFPILSSPFHDMARSFPLLVPKTSRSSLWKAGPVMSSRTSSPSLQKGCALSTNLTSSVIFDVFSTMSLGSCFGVGVNPSLSSLSSSLYRDQHIGWRILQSSLGLEHVDVIAGDGLEEEQ